jgi:hypothetical protein
MQAQSVQQSSRLLPRRSGMRKTLMYTQGLMLLAGQRPATQSIQWQPPQAR